MKRTHWPPGMALDDDQINYQEQCKQDLIRSWIKHLVFPGDEEPGGPYIPISEDDPDQLLVYPTDSGEIKISPGYAVDKNGEIIHIASDAGPYPVPNGTYTVYITYIETYSQQGNFEPGYPQGGEPDTWKVDDSYQVDIAQSPPSDSSIPLAQVSYDGSALTITDLRPQHQMSARITRDQIYPHFHHKSDFPAFFYHSHKSYPFPGASGIILNAPTRYTVLLWRYKSTLNPPGYLGPTYLRLIPTKKYSGGYQGLIIEAFLVHAFTVHNDSDQSIEISYQVKSKTTGKGWLKGYDHIPAFTDEIKAIELGRPQIVGYIRQHIYLEQSQYPNGVLEDWFELEFLSGGENIDSGSIWLQIDPRMR